MTRKVNTMVTMLHCVECGTALEIRPEQLARPEARCGGLAQLNGSIPVPQVDTPATWKKVYVVPCEVCKAQYAKPALALATLLSDIGKLQERLGEL